jgi:fibronectin type 3 domain-containing protein
VRTAPIAVALLLALTTSCGYVGPIVPPSPLIPERITDLAVIERGDELIITFTTPPRTTDAVEIERLSHIDLRVGPASDPFDLAKWENTSKRYAVETYTEGGVPSLVTRRIPASEWQGQKVHVAVRTAVKKTGNFSQWSNLFSLEVIRPLQPPALVAEATKDGYRLTWNQERPDLEYQIRREGPSDKAPVVIGTTAKSECIDTTSQWDTAYTYTVVARKGAAESLPSAPKSVIHADTFPPSVPTNVVALPAPDSIELTWSRSPEPDLKGYYVFRSTSGRAFERQGDLVTLPTFSDRKVEHGKTYRYAISSVDQKGNVSEKSAPVEVSF